MKIIQNFSSKKHIKSMPVIDILIWYIGLFKLREFGYTIKLYCEEKDFIFLKKWGLYKFFDEFDTTFIPSDPIISQVNGENFWSIRKIECIDHEFQVSTEPFIYLDTDIILNIPIKFYGDLMIWSPEDPSPIYPDWQCLSTPQNKPIPDYAKNINDAFNTGLFYFYSYELFSEYRKIYLDFVIDNPCIAHDLAINNAEEIRNIWACNAEQRLLKAFAIKNNLQVYTMLERQDFGANDYGIHFYYYRKAWKALTLGLLKEDKVRTLYWSELLNFHLQQFLEILATNDEEAFNIFIKIKWLNDLFYQNKKVTKYK